MLEVGFRSRICGFITNANFINRYATIKSTVQQQKGRYQDMVDMINPPVFWTVEIGCLTRLAGKWAVLSSYVRDFKFSI